MAVEVLRPAETVAMFVQETGPEDREVADLDGAAVLKEEEPPLGKLFTVLRQPDARSQSLMDQIIAKMLSLGAHPNDTDSLSGNTMLHYACKAAGQSQQVEEAALRAIEQLLEQGAAVNIRNALTDMTPLHTAAFFASAAAISLLCESGRRIDLEVKCSEFEDCTALHLAVLVGSFATVEALLIAGADKATRDGERRTPIQLARIMATSSPDPLASRLTTGRYEEVQAELDQASVEVGDRVRVTTNDATGLVRFVGPVHFRANVELVGVQLDAPVGKHNGTVHGQEYFRCKPNHGVLVAPDKVVILSKALANIAQTPRKASATQVDFGTKTSIQASQPSLAETTTNRTLTRPAKRDTERKAPEPEPRPVYEHEKLVKGDRVLVRGKHLAEVGYIGPLEREREREMAELSAASLLPPAAAVAVAVVGEASGEMTGLSAAETSGASARAYGASAGAPLAVMGPERGVVDSDLTSENEDQEQDQDRDLEQEREHGKASPPAKRPYLRKPVDEEVYQYVSNAVRQHRLALSRSLSLAEKWDVVATHAHNLHEAYQHQRPSKASSAETKKLSAVQQTARMLRRSPKLCASVWSEFVKTGTVTAADESGPRGKKRTRFRRTKALKMLLRNWLYEQQLNRQRVVAKDVLQFLVDHGVLPAVDLAHSRSRESALRSVQRYIAWVGFKRARLAGQPMLLEPQHVLVQRDTFVRRMLATRLTRRIVYLDEGCLHHHYQRPSSDGSEVDRHRGRFYSFIGAIVSADPTALAAAAASADASALLEAQRPGLLFETVEVFDAAKKAEGRYQSKDYRESFDNAYMQEWMAKCLGVLAERNIHNAVIVMDQARHHTFLPASAPQPEWSTARLRACCAEHGIATDLGDTHLMLWQRLQAVVGQPKPQLVAMAEAAGHEVLFLPPHYSDLQPLGMIWSFIKDQVAQRYTPTTTFDEVLLRFYEALGMVTADLVGASLARVSANLDLLNDYMERLERLHDSVASTPAGTLVADYDSPAESDESDDEFVQIERCFRLCGERKKSGKDARERHHGTSSCAGKSSAAAACLVGSY
ncbi:uncharacterized protein MONBRDRAFT_27930 [Monosiga brevicollis MX1]|uniref:CAP-Gly domain-containing protein n=1 Tax=Monosiga brevicollis TaxID=81824 RepID=A9V6F9_MONBE|nr:uncharacterized protein MONBRDRAFT_27930 [Monosiga brevicollis MX1]EDQ86800.1 predicted protein [Monosiga brevicollis MX1]|eukprot:XP_001748345.1 hypothetical protein [Monosiga brevicollis MX1]